MASLMRKAAASFRSGLEGHKELQHAIAAEKNAKAAHKTWTATQTEAITYLSRWGHLEANPAFQDVFERMLELNKLWEEAQVYFSHEIREYRKVFESILVQEKQFDALNKNKVKAEQHEKTAEKNIQSLQKKGENTAAAETKLEQARRVREMAVAEVETATHDQEEFKNRAVKEAVDRMSDAYLTLFEKGTAIFKAQKGLAGCIPDEAPHLGARDAYNEFDLERTADLVAAAKENITNIELMTSRKLSAAAGPASPASAKRRTDATPPPYQAIASHSDGPKYGHGAAAHQAEGTPVGQYDNHPNGYDPAVDSYNQQYGDQVDHDAYYQHNNPSYEGGYSQQHNQQQYQQQYDQDQHYDHQQYDQQYDQHQDFAADSGGDAIYTDVAQQDSHGGGYPAHDQYADDSQGDAVYTDVAQQQQQQQQHGYDPQFAADSGGDAVYTDVATSSSAHASGAGAGGDDQDVYTTPYSHRN